MFAQIIIHEFSDDKNLCEEREYNFVYVIVFITEN